jgi:hypothetical protein
MHKIAKVVVLSYSTKAQCKKMHTKKMQFQLLHSIYFVSFFIQLMKIGFAVKRRMKKRMQARQQSCKSDSGSNLPVDR